MRHLSPLRDYTGVMLRCAVPSPGPVRFQSGSLLSYCFTLPFRDPCLANVSTAGRWRRLLEEVDRAPDDRRTRGLAEGDQKRLLRSSGPTSSAA